MHRLKQIGLTLLLCALGLDWTTARADVVIVVSSKSLVTKLNKDQVADIFLGKSRRFPDGTQATPLDQPEASSVRDSFYSTVVGKSPSQLKAYWSKIIFTGRGQPPRTVLNSGQVKKFLVENPLAISYMEADQVDSTVRALPAP